jgi:hypothetical protein
MQLLIVHEEAEIGEGLRAETHGGCDLLLTQLESATLDGLALTDSLGAISPAMQTLFLPAYPLAEQRLEVANTKIFPEPIDGERLLLAIERAAESNGGANAFHVVDLLQMFCLSGKSGAVQLFANSEAGVVFLRNGELRHATTAHAFGLPAIFEIMRWGPVTFFFDANASPSEQTIDIGWDAALVEVVMREREEQALQPGAARPEVEASLLPPEPDLTGEEFGTYRVGRKLTESFWDKVYEAEQTSIGRQVALHVLRSSLRQIPERAQEFLDTASANANVRHPAILPVYEAGEFEGTYFYAREFIVGRTLYEIRAAGLTISALVALRLIRAIADALTHLDDHQILHAPLRPSRIFVTPNDEARLADVAVANPAMAQLSPPESEIRMVGRMLLPMMKETTTPGSSRLLKLIQQMQSSGADAITQWSALAEEAKKLEAILVPPPAPAVARKTGLLEKVKAWGKRA